MRHCVSYRSLGLRTSICIFLLVGSIKRIRYHHMIRICFILKDRDSCHIYYHFGEYFYKVLSVTSRRTQFFPVFFFYTCTVFQLSSCSNKNSFTCQQLAKKVRRKTMIMQAKLFCSTLKCLWHAPHI